METIILKVGGSVCTSKEENECKVKENVVRRIAREIKKAKEEMDFRIILIHGAGPFGHKLVSEYGINNGLKDDNDIEGFVRTHNSMEDLNKSFMDIFREEGLLGFPIQTSACIIQDNKRITKFDTEIIERVIELDDRIIPMMYGDMVIDSTLKGSVVSGDAIIAFLARKLGIKKIFIGTDVDGIFRADPKKDSNTEMIKEINNENFDDVLEMAGESSSVDVTKGMFGKLIELKENLTGAEVIIFNAKNENNTYIALSGGKIGTTIKV